MQVELQVVQSSRDRSTMVDVESIPVTGDKFIIGRAGDCHFRPDSKLLSRHHCVLLLDDLAVRIRDLGSRNGTLVNGRRVLSDVVLSDGDIIVVGDLTLRVAVSNGGESIQSEDKAARSSRSMETTPS